MQHPFAALRPEYESLLARMVVTRQREVDQVAGKLLAFVTQGRYAEVSAQLGIPQILIATSFERESSSNFNDSPAQGDPWRQVSRNVPRGRGPFASWKDAAIDAYKLDGLDQVGTGNWTWARFCYEGELFNGFGYRAHGVHTPYDWAGSNDYVTGKYVRDGVFDMNHADTQLGIVPVARAMVAAMPSLDIPGWPARGTAVVGASDPPQPAPVGVGGEIGNHDAAWVQQSLNKLGFGPLQVDGNYGRRTRAAVLAFQQAHGLEADGLAGPVTDAAIEKAAS
jgi:lysozyme family protein